MDPIILERFIHSDEALSLHKDYLNTITKPSVDISFSNDEAKDHESRFGVSPLVPKHFVWPTHKDGEYRFLGQINFSEMRHCPDLLPKSGLLSLFYAFDERETMCLFTALL